jgi:hypothetical protein
MNNLENLSFDEIKTIYSQYFTLGYLGASMSDKMACIALTCSITNELKKKGKKVTCYDVLLKVGKFSGFDEKDVFLKVLGAICEDFMYGCKDFLDFGIPAKEQPKQLKNLLDKYCPF